MSLQNEYLKGTLPVIFNNKNVQTFRTVSRFAFFSDYYPSASFCASDLILPNSLCIGIILDCVKATLPFEVIVTETDVNEFEKKSAFYKRLKDGLVIRNGDLTMYKQLNDMQQDNLWNFHLLEKATDYTFYKTLITNKTNHVGVYLHWIKEKNWSHSLLVFSRSITIRKIKDHINDVYSIHVTNIISQGVVLNDVLTIDEIDQVLISSDYLLNFVIA
ncbi:hypothetical protein QTN25_009777 [Entamoeba marina]